MLIYKDEKKRKKEVTKREEEKKLTKTKKTEFHCSMNKNRI